MLWHPFTWISRPVRLSTTTFPEISPPVLTVLAGRTSVAEREGLTATMRIAVASATIPTTVPTAMAISRVRLTQAMVSLGFRRFAESEVISLRRLATASLNAISGITTSRRWACAISSQGAPLQRPIC